MSTAPKVMKGKKKNEDTKAAEEVKEGGAESSQQSEEAAVTVSGSVAAETVLASAHVEAEAEAHVEETKNEEEL